LSQARSHDRDMVLRVLYDIVSASPLSCLNGRGARYRAMNRVMNAMGANLCKR
jgi:hypothetical protein